MRWQVDSTEPIPEVRNMVATARKYAEGELHFSEFLAHVQECAFWAKVHNAHPQVLKLVERWLSIGRHVWPEMSGVEKWPESVLLEQVKADIE